MYGVTEISVVSRKKAFERFLLDQFLSAGAFDVGAIEEHESPDFIVRISEAVVGIEVTQAFATFGGDSAALSAEALMHRIVSKAQRIYIESDSRPAQVRVTFKSPGSVRSLRRDETSVQLAEYVRRLNLAPYEKSDAYEWQGNLPVGIASAHVTGIPQHSMGHWGAAQSGWVEPVTEQLLQQSIDAKATRLVEYRRNNSEVWLAIVVYGMRASGLVEVREDFNPRAVASPFERTYFYRHPDRHVLRLGDW